jgi:hypothetical protein
MRKIATALLLLAVGVPAAGASLGRTAPSLRIVRRTPLVVRGAHFRPAEKVTVRAPRTVRIVDTTATGAFRVSLAPVPADRCSFRVAAVGAHGDRAQVRARAMCPPA